MNVLLSCLITCVFPSDWRLPEEGEIPAGLRLKKSKGKYPCGLCFNKEDRPGRMVHLINEAGDVAQACRKCRNASIVPCVRSTCGCDYLTTKELAHICRNCPTSCNMVFCPTCYQKLHVSGYIESEDFVCPLCELDECLVNSKHTYLTRGAYGANPNAQNHCGRTEIKEGMLKRFDGCIEIITEAFASKPNVQNLVKQWHAFRFQDANDKKLMGIKNDNCL